MGPKSKYSVHLCVTNTLYTWPEGRFFSVKENFKQYLWGSYNLPIARHMIQVWTFYLWHQRDSSFGFVD
jgi:hypothetical protein